MTKLLSGLINLWIAIILSDSENRAKIILFTIILFVVMQIKYTEKVKHLGLGQFKVRRLYRCTWKSPPTPQKIKYGYLVELALLINKGHNDRNMMLLVRFIIIKLKSYIFAQPSSNLEL